MRRLNNSPEVISSSFRTRFHIPYLRRYYGPVIITKQVFVSYLKNAGSSGETISWRNTVAVARHHGSLYPASRQNFTTYLLSVMTTWPSVWQGTLTRTWADHALFICQHTTMCGTNSSRPRSGTHPLTKWGTHSHQVNRGLSMLPHLTPLAFLFLVLHLCLLAPLTRMLFYRAWAGCFAFIAVSGLWIFSWLILSGVVSYSECIRAYTYEILLKEAVLRRLEQGTWITLTCLYTGAYEKTSSILNLRLKTHKVHILSATEFTCQDFARLMHLCCKLQGCSSLMRLFR